jgi:hypothetical protein
VSVEEPGDLDRLADGLEELLDAERPFALVLNEPRDLDYLQAMLWDAPNARRRLRRLRARLAAWCEATAHVLAPDAYARTQPSTLRYAELIWGCEALAADCAETAADTLLARLAMRPAPAGDLI